MSTMSEIEAALQALAERGHWIGCKGGDAEMVRVEVRRAARKVKINVRTLVDRRGRPHAFMPDGFPAHEPLRGAAIHAYESGAESTLVADALDRFLRGDNPTAS